MAPPVRSFDVEKVAGFRRPLRAGRLYRLAYALVRIDPEHEVETPRGVRQSFLFLPRFLRVFLPLIPQAETSAVRQASELRRPPCAHRSGLSAARRPAAKSPTCDKGEGAAGLSSTRTPKCRRKETLMQRGSIPRSWRRRSSARLVSIH